MYLMLRIAFHVNAVRPINNSQPFISFHGTTIIRETIIITGQQ